MVKHRDKIKAAIWMINHYKKLALECRDLYDNLTDFYIVYDHYMLAIAVHEDILDKLLEEL